MSNPAGSHLFTKELSVLVTCFASVLSNKVPPIIGSYGPPEMGVTEKIIFFFHFSFYLFFTLPHSMWLTAILLDTLPPE